MIDFEDLYYLLCYIIIVFILQSDLARKAGYGVEEHKVRTEDGYFLLLHRITAEESLNTKNKQDPNIKKENLIKDEKINENNQ